MNPPRTVEEHETIEVMCMTSTTCPAKLQLLDHNLSIGFNKVMAPSRDLAWASAKAHWQDDGQTIVCQAQGNTDKYLRAFIALNITCKNFYSG